MTKQDLTIVPIGERYGSFTILAWAGRAQTGLALWLCRCGCGREAKRSASAIIRGDIKRCAACAAQARPGVYAKRALARQNLSPKELEVAIRLWKQSWDTLDIARVLHVTEAAVYNYLPGYRAELLQRSVA